VPFVFVVRDPRSQGCCREPLTPAAHGLSYPDFTKENYDGRPQEEADEVHEAPPHP
jgi:hypothetical protein